MQSEAGENGGELSLLIYMALSTKPDSGGIRQLEHPFHLPWLIRIVLKQPNGTTAKTRIQQNGQNC